MKKSNLKDRFSFIGDYIQASFHANDTKSVIENSKAFFGNLMDSVHALSTEGETRPEEIFEFISQLLQEELEGVCKQYGISREEMQKLVADPMNFKPEDWAALQELKEDLSLTAANGNKSKKAKVKKCKKNWSSV